MRKVVRVLIPVFAVVVFLSGCATTMRKEVPYYDFQGMAKDGVIVVTVDAVKEQELVNLVFSDLEEFARRAERISLSIEPRSMGYPLEMEDVSAFGVVEGDYPKFLLNTGMMYARELKRISNDDGLTWFTQKDGELSLYTPKNGKVLFTNASYPDAYAAFDQKDVLIDQDTARLMVDASFAVYVHEPTTFFDLGLGIPDTVVQQAKTMVLLINSTNEGSYAMDAFITMDTTKLATTLSQMVRTGYLARLKREKISFKIADLMQMFMIKDDLVTIKHMDLGEEQMQVLRQSLTGML